VLAMATAPPLLKGAESPSSSSASHERGRGDLREREDHVEEESQMKRTIVRPARAPMCRRARSAIEVAP